MFKVVSCWQWVTIEVVDAKREVVKGVGVVTVQVSPHARELGDRERTASETSGRQRLKATDSRLKNNPCAAPHF